MVALDRRVQAFEKTKLSEVALGGKQIAELSQLLSAHFRFNVLPKFTGEISTKYFFERGSQFLQELELFLGLLLG